MKFSNRATSLSLLAVTLSLAASAACNESSASPEAETIATKKTERDCEYRLPPTLSAVDYTAKAKHQRLGGMSSLYISGTFTDSIATGFGPAKLGIMLQADKAPFQGKLEPGAYATAWDTGATLYIRYDNKRGGFGGQPEGKSGTLKLSKVDMATGVIEGRITDAVFEESGCQSTIPTIKFRATFPIKGRAAPHLGSK